MARPTVLLFDIDGTLISTGGAGRRAIVRTLERAGCTDCTAFSFAGMTDRAILRQGLTNAARPATDEAIDALLEDYVDFLREEVAAATTAEYVIHSGMLEALDRAEAADGVAVGLGTGNVERGARIKLDRVDLSRRFSFGGFGCDSENRAELLRAGAERGAALLGATVSACRVVVIGDTPRDIDAARAIDADCLAVGTGGATMSTLRAHRPTWLFESLAAPGAIAAMLGKNRV